LSACWLTWPRRACAGAECFRLCRELLDGILLVRSGLLVEVAHVSACRNAYHLEYITQGAAVQVCTSLQVVHAHACNANFHVAVLAVLSRLTCLRCRRSACARGRAPTPNAHLRRMLDPW